MLVRYEGHNFEYDMSNLIRVFFPNERIIVSSVSSEDRIIEVILDNNVIKLLLTIKGEIAISSYEDVISFEKKTLKNQFKRFLYRELSNYTGETLPWGTLTGIRPTKISMELLYAGYSDKQIEEILSKDYYISQEKINLSLEVTKKEKEILDVINDQNSYSLYIGIPFCPSKCLYCSFTSFPLNEWQRYTDSYLNALFKEIKFVARAMKHKKLVTIYIGGGTPTSLSESQLDKLLEYIGVNFNLDNIAEYTVEAGRPDTITEEKLKIIKKHNVSRISINPQTMVQETLEIIGRRHTVDDVINSYNMAREIGFDNINMDLIIGLPNEDVSDVEHTLNEVLRLRPDSLTVHSLAVKRASELSTNKSKYVSTDYDEVVNMQTLSEKYARQMGMRPYYLYRQKNIAGNIENVGYSCENKEGIYNILIMEEIQSIIALGAGASTKLVYRSENRIERIENVKNVVDYINRIDEMLLRKDILLQFFNA